MTPQEITKALARCDQEIERIQAEAETGQHPAWLIELALNDWRTEKLLILEELNRPDLTASPDSK